MLAFATRAHPELVVLVLPLVGLLRTFGLERQRRIDHALELSDAYRGTALLLGDVIELHTIEGERMLEQVGGLLGHARVV